MASLNKLLQGPFSTNTPMYNPDTALQYQAGHALPGENLVQSLLTPGGLESATGLKTGWAPQIGHITTQAETAKRRKATNPLLTPVSSKRSKNPFVIEQVPSVDLFGLNLAT